MNMKVESVEGQTVSDVDFTIRFQQVTPVRISDIEGTASILLPIFFESASDDGTNEKTSEDLDLDAEFEVLGPLDEQLVELERVILMKAKALSGALGRGPKASGISDCDSLRCVVSSIYHKVSGAAKALYAGDMEDFFGVGGGHHRHHPHWRHKKFGGPHRRPRRPWRRPHHEHEAADHTRGNHSTHHPPHEGMSRPGRHHDSPPGPHRGPPGRHHPGKFPHEEFPDEERPDHRRPRPIHAFAGDMPSEVEHHEHERPASPDPEEDKEKSTPSEDMRPLPPPTGGQPHRGPGRPKPHGGPEHHGGSRGDFRRPQPSAMVSSNRRGICPDMNSATDQHISQSRFPIRHAVKLGATLILVGVFISILHRRCFRVGGLSREERRAHRKARCAARRAARCQRRAECRGAGRGGFLGRFFCRLRCEAEAEGQEKAAMLSAREEDSNDERMSVTMDEEIESFRVAASMVSDIVAAEEGRACEERQQRQWQTLQIPQTVAPAPGARRRLSLLSRPCRSARTTRCSRLTSWPTAQQHRRS